MRYVRAQGYPSPAVYDAGDGYLIMERIEGPTMAEALLSRPYLLARHARTLASLHERLHAIEALPSLPRVDLDGDRLLHRDLHPLNVMMSAGGPVVIDWANAARGDPAYDVADTLVVLASAEIPGSRVHRAVGAVFRRTFLGRFLGALGALDADRARQAIPVVVKYRLQDRNMSQAEKLEMTRLADWATAR